MSGFLSGRTSLTTVQTADIANDAITLAKMAAGTDGNVITYDTSGDPAVVATGTSGHFLKSAGAGAVPTFAADNKGAMTLIGTATASSSATITVTGLDTTYETYAIELVDLVPATDSVDAWLRLGDSGGIDSATGDYTWGVGSDNAGDPVTNSTSSWRVNSGDNQAYMKINPTPGSEPIGSATGEGFSASIKLYSGSDVVPLISGTSVQTDRYNTGPSGGLEVLFGCLGGSRADSIAVTQVQFLFSSGNITSGTLSVYGISKT